MARSSRKNAQLFVLNNEFSIYETGVYCRLSVEDNGKADGDSIENQKDYIMDYLKNNSEFHFHDFYIDNGYSGTNFDRPEFKRMLDDARKGKINCIIVKDLSRLGRNYVEMGEFLEKLCPLLDIRFVSINDRYDTEALDSNTEMTASLKNVINDIYAKDISKKASSALKTKRQNGEYVGSYAPYGYLKDPKNKNHLIPDEDIVPIVNEIFELRASGKGVGTICRILNEKDIPSPGRLKFERGIITNNNKKGSSLLWNRHVLKDILENIAYIGHLAQGKSSSSLHQGIAFHRTSEDEWDIVRNTHDAIISDELWKKVQTVNKESADKATRNKGRYDNLPKVDNLFGKKLVCADCGRVIKLCRSISTKKDKAYYNYKCPQNIELGDAACPKKSIKAEDLHEAVLAVIKVQLKAYSDNINLLQQLLLIEKQRLKNSSSAETIKDLQQQIKKKKGFYTSLYTDYKDGILSLEEYNYSKEKYQTEISELEKQIAELQSESKKYSKAKIENTNWSLFIKKFYKAKVLTSDMVNAMIDTITLDDENNIKVTFNYMNEYEELIRTCIELRKEVA